MNNEFKRPELIRVAEDDLTYIGTGKYIAEEYWYEGKPFAGFVVIDYHDNGNIQSEQEYVDGQTMGWEVLYYENGKIEIETLMYGATSVVYREYTEEGELLEEGWVYPKEFYNSVARETGMEAIEEYGFTDE
ncbi:hypothetical protein [Dokdonia sp.]|uniref:hypothetical protein n=1 Tax=Dokdonia sp. TaxID=2024995 RepID=UPI003264FFD7